MVEINEYIGQEGGKMKRMGETGLSEENAEYDWEYRSSDEEVCFRWCTRNLEI